METPDSGHKTVGWPELWQWRGMRLDWSLPCLDRQGGVLDLWDLQLLCKGRKASGGVGMGAMVDIFAACERLWWGRVDISLFWEKQVF